MYVLSDGSRHYAERGRRCWGGEAEGMWERGRGEEGAAGPEVRALWALPVSWAALEGCEQKTELTDTLERHSGRCAGHRV